MARNVREDGGEDTAGQLRRGGSVLGLDIDPETLTKLDVYAGELLRWNRKINLIAKNQTLSDIVESHFLDSLLLLPYLQGATALIDVGSGAGFPGLVCKAALPALPVVLVEPRLKRVSFLRHVIRTLKLEQVTVLADRLENIPGERLACSHITSRAVAEIGEFIVMIDGVVAPDTSILCMKGPKWQEELDRAKDLLRQRDLVLERVDEYRLPRSGAARAVLLFRRGQGHNSAGHMRSD